MQPQSRLGPSAWCGPFGGGRLELATVGLRRRFSHREGFGERLHAIVGVALRLGELVGVRLSQRVPLCPGVVTVAVEVTSEGGHGRAIDLGRSTCSLSLSLGRRQFHPDGRGLSDRALGGFPSRLDLGLQLLAHFIGLAAGLI